MGSNKDKLQEPDLYIENEKDNSPLSDLEPIPDQGTPERAIAERKLVRKLDTRIVPTVILIYIMNYIDRNGITTARLQGLEHDLGLTTIQYSVVLSILFVSYCPMQVPSNMLINYVSRPSLYIGTCVVLWGLTSALTGITKNFSGIAACRVFIGLPEAAFYPGTVYLLSRWYTKKELAFRGAILFGGLLISNAFGALIAAGILANMEGKRGIRAWRWLFYIEGAITICVGLLSMWLLPNYPHNTSWVTGAERRLAQARLAEDAGEADKDNKEDSPLRGLLLAVKDPKVWIFSVMNCAQLLGLSNINFFPTLTQTLGFDTTITLVLAAPPWISATVICCLNAWHADRTGERFFHIAGWWWVTIIGYIIGLLTMSIPARYFSMFLMSSGDAGFAMTLVWVSNVIPRPPAKRAAAMGIVNGIGNLGNLISSFTWEANWGPEYHQSFVICLCSLLLSTALAIWLRQILAIENRKRDEDERAALKGADRLRVEEAARLEGITFEHAMEKRKGFRYLY